MMIPIGDCGEVGDTFLASIKVRLLQLGYPEKKLGQLVQENGPLIVSQWRCMYRPRGATVAKVLDTLLCYEFRSGWGEE